MKALRCKNVACAGHPQMPGVATLRDGSPYFIGRPPVHWPYRLQCWTCKRKTLVTQIEYNALPEIKPEDIAHIPVDQENPSDHADFRVMTGSLRGDG